jgi:hypothetical protein
MLDEALTSKAPKMKQTKRDPVPEASEEEPEPQDMNLKEILDSQAELL